MQAGLIQIGPEAEDFFIATKEGWIRLMGHSISVDNYHFCAIPIAKELIVSEVTSGARVFHMSVPEEYQTYEQTMALFSVVVSSRLISIIETENAIESDGLDKKIEEMRIHALKTCGEKPVIKKGLLH